MPLMSGQRGTVPGDPAVGLALGEPYVKAARMARYRRRLSRSVDAC